MATLLRSLFQGKPETSTEDPAHPEDQTSALHQRMQRLLRSTQSSASQRPTTDRFGRPLH
jgi:hypothetical protein